MKSKYKIGDTFKQGELTYKVTGFDAHGRAISAVCTEEELKNAKKEKATAKKEAEKRSDENTNENSEDTTEKATVALPVGAKEDTETVKKNDCE